MSLNSHHWFKINSLILPESGLGPLVSLLTVSQNQTHLRQISTSSRSAANSYVPAVVMLGPSGFFQFGTELPVKLSVCLEVVVFKTLFLWKTPKNWRSWLGLWTCLQLIERWHRNSSISEGLLGQEYGLQLMPGCNMETCYLIHNLTCKPAISQNS